MSSFHGLRLPPIFDSAKFENFIADLWCGLNPGALPTRYGRSGQEQHGVDVLVQTADRLIGVQCKATDGLTAKIFDKEVELALSFSPSLTHFVVATTAPHDARLVSHAAAISRAHRSKRLFEVSYFGWGDLLRMLEDFPDLALKHFPEFLGGADPIEAAQVPRVQIARMPTTSGEELFGRSDDLRLLDAAWSDKANIVTIIAMGGAGKTALVNSWLDEMQGDGWRGAAAIYAWSFYSQGTAEDRQASADAFFDHALRWFEYDGAPIGSAWERGLKLAELVAAQRTLLILDGLEPLQYPPGEMHGHIRDQGLQALLRQLSRWNRGLCVITTRMTVVELAGRKGESVVPLDLGNLHAANGVALLRHLGVRGAEMEMRDAVREFDGHALALSLLGNYLVAVHGGDIISRLGEPNLQQSVPGLGGHAERVMASYERWLGTGNKTELSILYMMGLFDRPAPADAIAALCREPVIIGLTDFSPDTLQPEWKFALQSLRKLHLLNPANGFDEEDLDAHPLIREYFGNRLRADLPEAFRAGQSRLYEYYRSIPDKFQPDTAEEMEPLIVAIGHGCKAGRLQETFDQVYWPRVKREDLHYNLHDLGLFGDDLCVLRNYFERAWTDVSPSLAPYNRAEIASWAGYCFQALGSLIESAPLTEMSYDLFVGQEKHWEAALASSVLGGIFLALGRTRNALNSANKAILHADLCDAADRPDRNYNPASFHTILADILHQSGDLTASRSNFDRAFEKQRAVMGDYPLYSLSGYRYWEYCLSCGNSDAVLEQAAGTLQDSTTLKLSVLGTALSNLAIGNALHQASVEKGIVGDTSPSHRLDEACSLLRRAGVLDHLPRGYLIRSRFLTDIGQFDQAHSDLAEAFDVANRGRMLLHLADCHLAAARLALARGGLAGTAVLDELSDNAPATAQDHVGVASTLISKAVYGRRTPDLALVKARISVASGDREAARAHLTDVERFIAEGWKIHRSEVGSVSAQLT